jgi:tetratricopeptide (TPR) repeat protein
MPQEDTRMAGAPWSKFPYEQKPYAYAGPALKKAWDRLHAGDLEPWPEAASLASLAGVKPGAAVPGFKGDFDDLALRLQEAWRAFHRGDFQDACEAGTKLGPLGSAVANKAAAVYCTYLEEDDRRAVRILTEAAARGDEACRKLPGYANAWYFHAFALGRYAQRISVLKALGEGIGGKVQKALETALKLEPRHADAHIALGAYHAEIIDKVGALAGRLTYGADRGAAVKHFEKAVKLNPAAAIAYMEYGNGLLMLEGEKKKAEAVKLYRKAAACKPADAMERLDVEQARAELE